MKRRMILVIMCTAILLTALGCTKTYTKIQTSNAEFMKGNVVKSETVLLELQEKKDHNFPLMQLCMGSIQLSLGDFRQAEQYFSAAIVNLDAAISDFNKAKEVLKSEMSRRYMGFPYEKVLAHTYKGLIYMKQGRHNEARIEFAQAREADLGKKAGQEDDFAVAHFLDGFNALKVGDYQYARVSFRKVSELKPEFPLGWYALMRASSLDGDEVEAEEAWKKYESLTEQQLRLARDGSTPCAVFWVDAGWGPLRKPDAFIGQFATWNKPKFNAEKIVLSIPADNAKLPAYATDDTYFQASTTGGFGEDVGKKVVSYVAKEGLKQICPCAVLFVGKSEADVRAWNICPGTVNLVAVPMPSEPSTVEVDALDKKGKLIPLYQQVNYYITGRQFESCDPVYFRVIPNADYRTVATK